jgi:hypothetical protein
MWRVLVAVALILMLAESLFLLFAESLFLLFAESLFLLFAESLFLLFAESPSSWAQSLTPLEIDWAQVFRLEWQLIDRNGRALIVGRIYNVSFYGVSRIQLLVDQLDASGRAVAQQIAWLGFSLQPGESGFFDVSVPNRDGKYDVRVYAFDRKFGEAPNRRGDRMVAGQARA